MAKATDIENPPNEPDPEEPNAVVEPEVVLPPVPKERGLVSVSPLQHYMTEVRKYPLLSAEDQSQLAIRYQQEGDVEAARRLATSMLRLVIKIAMEYRRMYMNLLDLIQEGNIG